MKLRKCNRFKYNRLGKYLDEKCEELKIGNNQLSKLLMPETTGSYISTIKFGRARTSEERIIKIAEFFGDEPYSLIFKGERIPSKIEKMILQREDIQQYLIREVEKHEFKGNIKED